MNTTALAAFAFFTLLWLVPAALSLPLTTRLVHALFPHMRNEISGANNWEPLAITAGFGSAFFLVVFSLVARIIPAHSASLFLTYILMAASAFAINRKQRERVKLFTKRSFLVFASLLLCHLAFWLPRTFFSDIQFDPNLYGAEKLFNLSLQQSFAYGNTYPPQSLWLAGEPVSYYILPRIFPGLATHFAIHYTGASAQIGGVFFHLSDTFFNALALITLTAAASLFLSNKHPSPRHRIPLSLAFGAFPFLAAPAQAFWQMFESGKDFWALSRIIPYTINEYPFWNYLFADNHAHNNAAFLDVLVTFLVLSLLWKGETLTQSVQHFVGAVLGVLATALAMSQSGSAFILVVLFSIPIFTLSFIHVKRGTLNIFVRPFLTAAIVTAVLFLPDALTRSQPHVLWHLVPTSLASSLLDFCNVNFSFLALFSILALSSAPPAPRSSATLAPAFSIFALLIIAAFAVAGFPAVSFAGALLLLSLLFLKNIPRTRQTLAQSVLLGFSLLFIFPEIVGINFNMGPQYIRLNTTFKFLYTSFFTLPLLALFIIALGEFALSPYRFRFLITASSAIFLALAFAQFATFQTRKASVHTTGGVSGLEFFKNTRPADSAILAYLNSIQKDVVLVEECGMPPKAASYSVAGRISAYSGRPALCGWGMHSHLHHASLKAPQRQNQSVWPYLIGIEQATSMLYAASDNSSQSFLAAKIASKKLQKEGATHVIVGEYERELHPSITPESIAATTGGTIVFQVLNFGVVELPSPSGDSP
jgi:uncharacterized membrane protein